MRKKEQVIFGLQRLPGFQHCPAILSLVSSQLLLPHSTVGIMNFITLMEVLSQPTHSPHMTCRLLHQENRSHKHKLSYLFFSSFHLKTYSYLIYSPSEKESYIVLFLSNINPLFMFQVPVFVPSLSFYFNFFFPIDSHSPCYLWIVSKSWYYFSSLFFSVYFSTQSILTRIGGRYYAVIPKVVSNIPTAYLVFTSQFMNPFSQSQITAPLLRFQTIFLNTSICISYVCISIFKT
jgi:hypothetical protein